MRPRSLVLDHGEAWRALLAVIRVENGRHARPHSQAISRERPGVRSAEVGIPPAARRAVVEGVREVVVGRLAAHGEERGGVRARRRPGDPGRALGEASEGRARRKLGPLGKAGLEEHRAADAQPIGVDRGVASVHLDAIDHEERHGRQVRRAGEVVVQADTGEVHRGFGARGTADGRRGEVRRRPGSRYLDAGNAREHVGCARTGRAQLFSGHHRGRCRDVAPGSGPGLATGHRWQEPEACPQVPEAGDAYEPHRGRGRASRHGQSGCTMATASRS